MSQNKIHCKNCEQEFEEGFEFCPHCGQKSKDELTMGLLFYNTISNYFSFDARFLKSFFPLLFRPGYLPTNFVGGKRLQYLHPAQYYLFVSVIFFFLFSFQTREYNLKADDLLKKGFESEGIINVDSISKSTVDSTVASISRPLKDNQVITGMSDQELQALDSIIIQKTKSKDDIEMDLGYDGKKLDSLIAVGAPEEEQLKAIGMKEDASFIKRRFYMQVLKFQKNRGGGIAQAFFDSIPIALFVLLPIFALLLKLFFWRRGHYSHHLVFSFYYFSFMFLVLSFVMLINLFWKIPDWIDWLVVLSTYLYLWFAIKNFYRQGIVVSFFKTGGISFIYMIMVIPIALTIMALSSFLFY